jgi:sRNA-binding protein
MKYKLILMIVILFAGILQAQERRRPEQPQLPDSTRVVEMVEEMAAELDLSTEQREMVEKLHQEHFNDARQLAEKARAEHERIREEMETKRFEFEKQIEALLTDEQAAKYREWKEKHGPGQKPEGKESKRKPRR